MATTTLTQMVTKTISGTGGTPTSSNRVASQGGVLDHQDPSHFDPKNPIALFIIQVRIPIFLPLIVTLADLVPRLALSSSFAASCTIRCPNFGSLVSSLK
jgi:hypothetical protein